MEIRDFNLYQESTKKAFWKKFQDIADKYNRRLQGNIRNTFQLLNIEVVKNIKLKGKLFDVKKWKAILTNNCKITINTMLTEIGNEALKEIGVKTYKQVVYKSEFEDIMNKVLSGLNDKIVMSIDTISNELIDIVKRTIEENPLVEQSQLTELCKESINYKFTEILNQSRVELISKETTNTAKNAMTDEVWKNEGFGSTWLHGSPKHPRHNHLEMNGVKQDEDGKFTLIGTSYRPQYPKDIVLPADESIGCDCGLFPHKL